MKNQLSLFIETENVIISVTEKSRKRLSAAEEGLLFGEMLDELMARDGVNGLSGLAKKTGVPIQTLDDWYNGRTVPLVSKNLLTLAQFFNVHLHYLCFGIGNDAPAFNNLEESA